MTRDGHIAADLDAARPVRLGAQPLTSRRGRDTRRPDDRFGGKTFPSDHDSFTIDRFDGRICSDFDPQTFEGLVRFFR